MRNLRRIMENIKIKAKYFYIYAIFKLNSLSGKPVFIGGRYRAYGKTTLITKQACKNNYAIITETFAEKDLIERRARKLMENNKIKRLPTIWCANSNMMGYGCAEVLLDCGENGYKAAIESNFKIVGGFVQN